MSIYSVAQVARYLKEMLEADRLLQDLWIAGEVSNLSTSQAGHVYFTLKDSAAQLRCVMFRRNNTGSQLLTNGSLVVAHGHFNLYEARGEISLIADAVMPEGAGPLYLEQERLRVKLEGEGLFEASRKRPLPPFPRVLGIVTSPTGAALQDIRKVLQSHYPLVEVLLAPTLVQGDEAAQGIVAALRTLNEDGRADAIIVARGGGSMEELWPFNEEAVARAIHASAIPVISGVGHERDVTIADMVADVRAPTPTAAAEMAVPNVATLKSQVALLQGAAWSALGRQLRQQRDGVATLAHRVERAGPDPDLWRRRVDDLAHRVKRAGPDLDLWRRRVDDLTHGAGACLDQRLLLSRAELAGIESRVRALDPAAVLARGYAIVETDNPRKTVTLASQVSDGDPLRITVSDGVIPATAGRPSASARRLNKPPKVAAGARLL